MPIDYVFAPLCPEFENLRAAQIAKARAEGKTSLALQSLCRKYDVHPPMDENVTKDGRQSVVAHKHHRRSLVQVAACWQHLGFAACYGTHHQEYDDTLCREIFHWLGIDPDKPTSRGTRRPACMAGAVAAYLARHANHRQLVQKWCAEYRRLCGLKGNGPTYTSVSGLYDRIAQRDATEGKEKTRVFFNAFMAVKAFCNSQTPDFSDSPEPITALADPTKA